MQLRGGKYKVFLGETLLPLHTTADQTLFFVAINHLSSLLTQYNIAPFVDAPFVDAPNS
jgi:hypothetical protein